MRGLTRLAPDLKRIQVIIGITIAIVGGTWGAYWAFESKYARAVDLRSHEAKEQRQIDGTRALILNFDLRDLRRERGQLLRQKSMSGRLTPYEQQRLEEINQDILKLEDRIRRLAPSD